MKLGSLQRKEVYFVSWFWSKVEGLHLVIASLQAESQSGTGDDTARDEEYTCVSISSDLSLSLSLLIQPPVFNHGDPAL
jgi:hypothetical protein